MVGTWDRFKHRNVRRRDGQSARRIEQRHQRLFVSCTKVPELWAKRAKDTS